MLCEWCGYIVEKNVMSDDLLTYIDTKLSFTKNLSRTFSHLLFFLESYILLWHSQHCKIIFMFIVNDWLIYYAERYMKKLGKMGRVDCEDGNYLNSKTNDLQLI